MLFVEVLDFFDMANRQDGSSQLSYRSKKVRVKKRGGGHLKWVRNGRVRLTCIFHMNFFFKKKNYICHLESNVVNYFM